MILLPIFFIRMYQRIVSPALQVVCGPGCGCRFYPTCSEYLVQALRNHGFSKGMGIGISRIIRCQPWGGGGYDPVPPTSKTLN